MNRYTIWFLFIGTISTTNIPEDEALPSVIIRLLNNSQQQVLYGDVVEIGKLKQQNDTYLRDVVSLMNNSYGVAMQKSSRLKRNRIEYRIQWLFDDDVKVGMKQKYLKIIPKIYIHNVSKCDPMLNKKLLMWLSMNSSEHIMYFPSNDPLYKILSNLSFNNYAHYARYVKVLKSIDFNKKDMLIDILSSLHLDLDRLSFVNAIEDLMQNDQLKQYQKKYLNKITTIFETNIQRLLTSHPWKINIQRLLTSQPTQSFRSSSEITDNITIFDKKTKKMVKTVLSKILDLNDGKNKRFWNIFFNEIIVRSEYLQDPIMKHFFNQLNMSFDADAVPVPEIISKYLQMSWSQNLHILGFDLNYIQLLQHSLAVFLNKGKENKIDLNQSQIIARSLIEIIDHPVLLTFK